MGTDWGWNSERRPVAMTEDLARMLVNQIVAGVTEARQSELLDHFKQFAQVQIELGQARADLQRAVEDAGKEIARKDAEIAALRLHIERLMNMLTPVSGNVQFNPYNNNGTNMTHPIPMPPLPASAPPYASQFYAPLQEPTQ